MVDTTARQKGFFPGVVGEFFKRRDTSEAGIVPVLNEELHQAAEIFQVLIAHAPVYFCECAAETILFFMRKFNAVLRMWRLFSHEMQFKRCIIRRQESFLDKALPDSPHQPTCIAPKQREVGGRGKSTLLNSKKYVA